MINKYIRKNYIACFFLNTTILTIGLLVVVTVRRLPVVRFPVTRQSARIGVSWLAAAPANRALPVASQIWKGKQLTQESWHFILSQTVSNGHKKTNETLCLTLLNRYVPVLFIRKLIFIAILLCTLLFVIIYLTMCKGLIQRNAE